MQQRLTGNTKHNFAGEAGQTKGEPDLTPPAGSLAGVQALYLHLPFCFHKCHYCDFFSVVDGPGSADRQEAFTSALCDELTGTAERFPGLLPATVFAGGGTPTYLREPLWGRLLETLHGLSLLDGCVEFTVEANPETLTPALMRRLKDGGVNRVSIGAQSFDRSSLSALERWHDPDNVARAVGMCRDAGITNVSLDLIFAIPGQTLAMLDADLAAALACQPTHLSSYGLTYEPNTALSARLRAGRVTPVDNDTEADMYDRVIDTLDAHGYEHYEVSNWALRTTTPRPAATPTPPTGDFRAHHNLAYWHNLHWLGVGPAAASHVAGHRWRNEPNLQRYLDAHAHNLRPPITDHEHLPPPRRVGEQLMLLLRLIEGAPHDWLAHNLSDTDRRHDFIREHTKLGFFESTPTHLRLTRRGRAVADALLAQLL